MTTKQLIVLMALLFITMMGCTQQYNAFTKYAGNPIITKNTGNYDSGDIANPDVFRDSLNHRWVMNYSAYGTIPSDASAKWRMCLAYSNNLLNWTKEPANPVFSPIAGEGYISSNGSIVYKNGLYYHFYQTGNSGDLPSTKIRLATSTNLINWTRQNGGNPIILPGATGSFDATACYDPCVRIGTDGETFEMYYAAYNTSNSIGFATSTDGVNWNKHGRIMSPQGWFTALSEPSGTRIGDAMYMTFDAAKSDPSLRSIGGAVTFDEAKSWQYFGFMLTKSNSGWDNAQVFDSYLLLNNKTWYLFYGGGITASGTQGMQSQIGVATAPYIQQSK